MCCFSMRSRSVWSVAYTPKDRKWLRYTGKAVFVESPEVEEKVFEHLPHLRNAYNETTGHKMMIFRLENATALLIDMAGNSEVIEQA